MTSAPVLNLNLNIKEFYVGKSILITGTTGFLGKILLEKVLRDLKGYRNIYLMIRNKPKRTLQQRLMGEILGSKLFQPLFTERPEILEVVKERVIPVYGDLCLEGLGLDPKDRQMLIDDVDVIMNGAASVNFMEPFRDAI